MKVKDLKPAPYNPRRISAEELDRLNVSMDEFGDLSGLVFNRRTKRIVGGHQRRIFFNDDWPITIEEEATDGNALDKHGTVARGYVQNPETHGKWSFRMVDWPEKREMAANYAANKQGGEFDPIMQRDLFEIIDDGSLNYELVGGEEHVKDVMTWNPEKANTESDDNGAGGSSTTECPSCGHEFKIIYRSQK